MKVYGFLALLTVAAAAVIAHGAALPPYRNLEWEAPFQLLEVTTQNSAEVSREWYAAKAQAETPRNRYLDLGLSLLCFPLSLALLFACSSVRDFRDLATITTPSSRRAFYVCAGSAWLSFVPAEWLWLAYTQHRGEYPWWADNIAIPAGGFLMFGVLGLPVILLGVTVALRGAQLPVPLWVGPAFGPPYLVCGGIIAASLFALLLIGSSVASEPALIPSLTFTLYLLLSGRAAAVSRGRRLTSGCS